MQSYITRMLFMVKLYRVGPVSSIVKEWVDIVHELGHRHGHTLLTMDNYYLDQVGRRYLEEKNVNYVASITQQRFKNLYDKLSPKVTKPGDWYQTWEEGGLT